MPHLDLGDSKATIGDTDLGKSSSVDERISRLLSEGKAEKDDRPNPSLKGIEEITGTAREEIVACNKLIPAPDEWQSIFPKATDETLAKMAVSIRQYGLLHRITVWERDNGYMILGGHTRAACFGYLLKLTGEDRYSTIPARIFSKDQISEVDAHRIFVISNTDQRSLSAKAISSAYAELMKLEKRKAFYGSGISTRDSAARQLGITAGTLSRYLRLQDLVEPLMDAVSNKELSLSAAVQISMMPHRLQQHVYETGEYIGMTRTQAKEILEAKNEEEIDAVLKRKKEPSYRYTVTSQHEKKDNEEIISLIVRKGMRQVIADAVEGSNLETEVKKILLAGLQGSGSS